MNNELPKIKIDERTGIEYRLEGDYYIQNLSMPKEEKITLNKYGRMRLNFLKENNIAIGVINAELLIYRYKNLSVPVKYNNLSRILKNRPEQLVSQGDCFLWDCLEDSFKVMPWNSGELKIKELIYYKYKKLTSEDLSLDSKVHIEKAMHYGLYFGNVNGEFWIKYGIPQIIKNYRICNRKLEFAMLSPFILILIIFGVLVGLGVIT